MKKIWFAAIVIVILAVAAGCSLKSSVRTQPAQVVETQAPTQTVIPPANGDKSDVISYVYTTKRNFAIVFSGQSDNQTMESILNELDKYKMKALFFLPAMRVAEEPEIAKDILQRGHTIGNDGLSETDLTKLDYNSIYDAISKDNEVIQDKIGVTPKYMWNQGGKYNDNVLMAAKQNKLAFVKYNIDLQGWQGKSAQEVQTYLENKITRGGVIALSTADLQTTINTIDIIAKVEQEMGYSVQPLDFLLANTYERKPLQEIPGWDAAKINPDYTSAQYRLIYNGKSNKKAIMLTFDDWGGDYSVTRLLDILDKYHIKATFFLRGDGVDSNPNLAKAIADDGMDVGNHTYTHPDTTKIAPDVVQQEVVKCHQSLTEALQRQPSMIFRPPYGEVSDSTAKAIAATGYKDIVRYNVTTYDWDTANKAEQIINTVMKETKSGSIILFHLMIQLDTYEALPTIIEYYQQRGYTFMTASQMISSGDAVNLGKVPSQDPENAASE